MNVLEAAWKTNLEVRPEKDWENLKGRLSQTMNSILQRLSKVLEKQNIEIIDYDLNRPWGSFFVIDENDSQNFANIYFNGLNTEELKVSGKLSPKILIIAPFKRLSYGSIIIEEVNLEGVKW